MAEGVAEAPVETFAEKWLEDLSENGIHIVFELEFVAFGLVDAFEAEFDLVHVLELGTEAEAEAEVEAEVGMGNFAMEGENDDYDDYDDTAAAVVCC